MILSAAASCEIFNPHGVIFRNKDLLRLALTHASKSKSQNNERLEFLGDRVLSLTLADILYTRYPLEPEGDLALRHAALVRADTLAQIARTLNIEAHLTLSPGDKAAGTGRLENVLADALESLLGALYLDQGYDVCAPLIQTLWSDAIDSMPMPPRDPKTQLQEWAQSRNLGLPKYTEKSRSGPDHALIFVVEVQLPGHSPQIGKGASLRIAEKAAASAFLKEIEEETSK